MPKEMKDVLGLASYGEALHTLTKGAVDGASAFLGRICLPAAEELGELFRDRIRAWRAANAVRIAQAAERKVLAASGTAEVSAHPRIVGAVFEHGSWSDNSEVQDMWAGLLASACTPDGHDEENYLFISLLQQLTTSQARILNYACTSAPKLLTRQGLIWGGNFMPTLTQVLKASDITDIHRLDRELDHLRALELIDGGYDMDAMGAPDPHIRLIPTSLALSLFVRCQGRREPPPQFFGVAAPVTCAG